MKRIIEYVPIITVCLIYFGFCNLHYYYKEFNIDVYHYVSNTEILLSFLPTIVVLVSSLYSFTYSRLIHYQSDTKNNNETINEEVEVEPKRKNKILNFLLSLPGSLFALITIEVALHLLLTKYYGFKPYELQDFNLIGACIFFALIFFSANIFKNQEVINNNLLLITIFSVIYIGNQFSTYRKLDADKIKDGISTKEIAFQYNKKKISTSKKLLYIGETQSNLFLYNKNNNSTLVYKTENIDSLAIKKTASNTRYKQFGY